ncbi:hypothetical protein KKC65_03585 [Patescibacteria group bacterium]|nr:hypothetical protein [Patescibacteria group bacterium]
MVYLVTHGERLFGVNPSHTYDGILQIEKLVLREEISLVVIGTGARFREIYNTMINRGHLQQDTPVKYSPFCGSADGLEANKDVILIDGTTVSLDDYISIGSNCFNAWKFISSLPDKTLLCAGGELMTALELANINKKGHLYELDPEAKTGKKIQ